MRSVSAIALLSAFGAVVNAAPATMNSVSRRQAGDKGTFTISQKAPFQDTSLLPPLNGASEVDLNMEGYEMGYHPNSDQYKCHGSCGIVLRINRLPASEKCTHPYAQPFVNFCFGTCKSLADFSPYPPALAFKNQCKLNAQEARSTTVEQVASTSAEAPASTSSSQPASTTGSPVSRPTGSAAPSGSSSQAPPASSPASSPSRTSAPHALPTGTASPRPPHPSGAASASGTAPKATPTNAGPVTAGAASTSFSVIAAITVATLAMIIA
ncbi:hypothetical protein MGU_00858 [Metarhizium guizhouense ARSEF 977]|uniref:Uncharacterized protein n=1 Tax=Metarhizium guizhouense (strain ARSEF 977) TaxID=1276136 RepID=A0A0B4HI45_METGA|nr:hypothetical protein MGU_00858 [Metarhizium guizhouense ARSEF 977]